jgi:hypothetical protein
MKRYYFAYGSNMHPVQMQKRCPDSRLIGPVRLDGWHITFSPKHSGANIYQLHCAAESETQAADMGPNVWGIAYEISEKDEAVLDICESVAQNSYEKTIIPCPDFKNTELLVYTVPACRGRILPYQDYHERIVDALEFHQICPVYISYIKKIGHNGQDHPRRNYRGDVDGT